MHTPLAVTPPAESKFFALLLPLAAVTFGALSFARICRRCIVRVHPSCVTIVYETRRKTILTTSMDKERGANDDMTHFCHFRPLMCMIRYFLYSSKSLVVLPPTSFFGAFTLPRAVLEECGEGRAVDCTVEAIQVTDGYVRMVLTIRYCIPFQQLERYLAAVGPMPPNERIAMAAAAAAKTRAAELSVGLIINKSRREDSFLVSFREHLASKLISEACVKLIDATVESAEICDKGTNV
ncbi:hypothetical protein TCSYLVIO_003558 [Trypanosoma cruzi]|uniref:Band 7 domain-containing protein n=1 Tax=Trypanosoma cruzi TaxID=5693 RepID=A0A2V2URM4_TRYCR|nr:hypothetical protein TCSYLVIO_003558 [Trypanosoma cruzi]PBJ74733.1 hypothetical protein BCY84_12060 [Trypanosoma cruzi cruzi]KAF8280493.1 hypothetical protein TcBrA4_0096180 [Trypanosoma cruzi]PBJ77544.1 hypothetical protein BCY84_06236 [Trypanosoma cruzi cruzi]PWU85792.1 hypothetical protein C4B63_144g27 [Trypanosoma cruzi]